MRQRPPDETTAPTPLIDRWYWSGFDAAAVRYDSIGPFSSRENAAEDAGDCCVSAPIIDARPVPDYQRERAQVGGESVYERVRR